MSFLFAFAFKGIRRCVKSPNSSLFGGLKATANALKWIATKKPFDI